MCTTFNGNLRPLQKEVRKEALSLLNKRGSCILSLYTGAGKTITAINIALREEINIKKIKKLRIKKRYAFLWFLLLVL